MLVVYVDLDLPSSTSISLPIFCAILFDVLATAHHVDVLTLAGLSPESADAVSAAWSMATDWDPQGMPGAQRFGSALAAERSQRDHPTSLSRILCENNSSFTHLSPRDH